MAQDTVRLHRYSRPLNAGLFFPGGASGNMQQLHLCPMHCILGVPPPPCKMNPMLG